MITIPLDAIQRDPISYFRRVQQGESFLIVENERVVAELKPGPDPPPDRPHGLAKGLFRVPDDFNDPLPEEILRDFEGR